MNTRKPPTSNLPFVGTALDSKRKSFWNLPEQGDYTQGTIVGEAMAAAYKASLAPHSDLPPTLPQIVLDITGAAHLSEARHGQLIGFFSAIEEAIRTQGA